VTAKWGTLDVTARRRRYVAVVIVGAVHILTLAIFIQARGTSHGSEEDTAPWTTLFFIPAEVVQRPPPAKVKPKSPSAIASPLVPLRAPEALSPITITPSASASAPQSNVDWMSELRNTAADAIKDRTGPGKPTDDAPSTPDSLWPAPLHHAGEQYTLETGELVVWVSDSCYMVSEPPLAGTPNAFAHLALTHTQCTGGPGPRSDLFKDLQAYKKRHPDE
jgi:hypothetical protein